MKTSSLVIGVLVAAAAFAAACGGGDGGSGFSDTNAGGGGTDGGTKTGSDGAQTLGGDGSVGTFGEGGGTKNDGGTAQGCDSSCFAVGGTCSGSTCTVTINPGNVGTATQGALQGGGSADSAFSWLYPYDRTVFPKGLVSPTMQFAGTAADVAYVHITSSTLDFRGYYSVKNNQLQMSQASWTAVYQATASGDPLVVEVTKSAGGAVTGPIKETWPIAQGNARGTIYYETYGSTLAGGSNSVGIMEIQPGATQPTVLKTGCGNVCHTASADGSTLVAATSTSQSASYTIGSSLTTRSTANGDIFTYGALYPDGKFEMSATNYRTWSGQPSRLYDTTSGAAIAASGWDGVVTNAGTASFSPDGKHLAFVHEDSSADTVAMMDFTASGYVFSNLHDIGSVAGTYAGWPAFTPDSTWVVFHAGSNAQFETDKSATGDLYIANPASHNVHRLDAMDGYGTSGTTYLPAGDPEMNFAPTVLPEAVGGYFWVVFTSHRSYGNTLPSKDNNDQNGKLWVAAIDLDPVDGKDPSHPAFYLDGQEAVADNLRGFWVLPPCQTTGTTCESGDQCCTGFCRSEDGGAAQCVTPPMGGCSNEYESCMTAADCCNPNDQCINGRCAQPAAQ